MIRPGSESTLAVSDDDGTLNFQASSSQAGVVEDCRGMSGIREVKKQTESPHDNNALIEQGCGQISSQLLSNGTPINVKYKGEWLDGRRSGHGCLISSLPSEYEGEWVRGRRHGSGMQIYPSGNVYEGHWRDDMKSGFGMMKWIDQQQIYEGKWQYDRPEGLGTHIWFRSCPGIELRKLKSLTKVQDRIHFCNRYRGQFKNGQRHGQGVFFYSNGAVYKGSWAHNRKHGPGTFIHINGRIETGIWDNDIIQSNMDPKQDVADAHLMSSLDFHVQCKDLLPMKASLSAFPETEMISTILIRYNDDLRRIFVFYGSEEDRTMPSLKLRSIWTWLRDCNLRSGCLTRAQASSLVEIQEEDSLSIYDGHRMILFREFHELLVRIGAIVYADRAANHLSDALNDLIQAIILPRFEMCKQAIKNNQIRSSADIMTRMAPFEGPLRSVFDQCKGRVTSTMPSRILFRLLLRNSIPSDTILKSFNDSYRCDLTDNQEIAIKAVDLTTDEVLYEEMVEIIGRSITSMLTLPNSDVDLLNWIQSFTSIVEWT